MFWKNLPRTLIILFLLSCVILAQDLFAEETNWKEISRIERSMVENGNYREAADELNSMLKDSPDDAGIYIALGTAYYGLMEYAKACEYFKKAKEIGAGTGSEDMLEYSISTIEENRQALDDIESASNKMKSDNYVEKELARESMATGHLLVLDRLVKEEYYFPSLIMPHIMWLKNNIAYMPGIYTLSADIYYSGMFYEKAIEDYKKAIEEEPDDVRLYTSLADSFVATGEFDGAQEYYEKAIQLYIEKGDKESADEASKLENIKRALPKRYEDIAELIDLGRYQEAEEICKRRISLNPGDYAAIAQMGQIYWKRGQRRMAIKLFRKAIRMAPDYPTAHLFLGKAYFFERKPEKGLAEFDIFKEKMELLPKTDKGTDEFYISALNYIGYMYATARQYEEAMKEYQKILKIDPEHQDAHYNLALCYYVHKHNRSKAYAELQKVIEIDPDTDAAKRSEYFIDYIRRNPDSRVLADFSFVYEE
ncbi:MAG: tetratricopeptide repeat protein [Candidatus Omnitrophota bacterium]